MGKGKRKNTGKNYNDGRPPLNGLDILRETARYCEEDYKKSLLTILKYLQAIRERYTVDLLNDSDMSSTATTSSLDYYQPQDTCYRLNHLTSIHEVDGLNWLTEEMKRLGWEYDMREVTFKRELQAAGPKIPWNRAIDKLEKKCILHKIELKSAEEEISLLREEEEDLMTQCRTYHEDLNRFQRTLQSSGSVVQRYRGKVVQISSNVTELEQVSGRLKRERKKLDNKLRSVIDELEVIAGKLKESRLNEEKEVERRKKLENLWKMFVLERESLRSEIDEMKDCWKNLEDEIGNIASQALKDCYARKDAMNALTEEETK